MIDKNIIKMVAKQNGIGYREVNPKEGGSIIDNSGKIVKYAHTNEILELLNKRRD